MDEHMESGSTRGEPGESDLTERSPETVGDSVEGLARGSDLSSPSPGGQRQRTSGSRSTSQPDLGELEDQIDAAVERRFQKAKDHRLARLEREFDALKELVVLSSRMGEAAGTPAASPAAARPAARASHVIQPSGGGLPPAPDLRAEYERRIGALRPGDVAGLLELKREYRKKGMDVY